jgi:hypothetical protein
MTVEQVAPGVMRFHKADREHASRLAEAPDQYVVNRRRARGLRPEIFWLHDPECRSIRADRTSQLTANEKWCGTRQALEDWVASLTNRPPEKCSVCWDWSASCQFGDQRKRSRPNGSERLHGDTAVSPAKGQTRRRSIS